MKIPSAAPIAALVCLFLLLMPVSRAQTYTWTNFVGMPGVTGTNDGTGTNAGFYSPLGLALDSSGNLYLADQGNDTIRMIASNAAVTTLAGLARSSGSTNGTGGNARFYFPVGVATDTSGNVYVADTDNHTIRKIAPGGVVSTLAGLAGFPGYTDGVGNGARFNYPDGVTVDAAGNVYVADTSNELIRKITPGGVVTTVAGTVFTSGTNDGTGAAALFNGPKGLALDSSTNLYVADTGNDTIRKITPAGVVTTLAGLGGVSGRVDATGKAARFYAPSGLAMDTSGNLYVADTYNQCLRLVTPAGTVTTLALGQFSRPYGIAMDASANLYVSDYASEIIKKGIPPYILLSLSIKSPTNNTVQVYWPSLSTGYQLQVNTNLTTTNWATPVQTIIDDGTNKSIFITPPMNNAFYRLKHS